MLTFHSFTTMEVSRLTIATSITSQRLKTMAQCDRNIVVKPQWILCAMAQVTGILL